MKKFLLSSAFLGLLIGALVTVTGLAVALFLAGAGHGSYLAAKILFPFAMLATVVGRSITPPFIALAFVQFPAYGFVLGRSFGSSRFRASVILIALVHVITALFVFARSDEGFS
ncbi:MAG TPA: hypothetical protein VFA58_07030 [Chthoniobacterales bacterium]|nr:hypothetical protein [Chthoniobacterales bacterium]